MTQGISDPRVRCLENDSSAPSPGAGLPAADDLIRRLSTFWCDPLQMRLRSDPGRPFHLSGSIEGERTTAIIAEEFEFIVGVDTHARTHTYTAVLASTGAVVDTAAFPATSPGMERAIAWIRRRTGGEERLRGRRGHVLLWCPAHPSLACR